MTKYENTDFNKILAIRTALYNKAKEDLGLLNGKLYTKTQECEELKEKTVDLMKALSIANTNLQEKEKECEKLRFVNSRLNIALGARKAGKRTFIDLAVKNDKLRAENEELKKEVQSVVKTRDNNFIHALELRKAKDKYKQALEMIKKIAVDEKCDMLGHFCVNCVDKSSCKTLKILGIISEVKASQ